MLPEQSREAGVSVVLHKILSVLNADAHAIHLNNEVWVVIEAGFYIGPAEVLPPERSEDAIVE